MEFRRISYANKIPIDKILHFSILFRKGKDLFQTHENFTKFKRDTLYPMLKDIGILGGVVFLHIWSNICKMCGEKEYFCRCNEEERVFEIISFISSSYSIRDNSIPGINFMIILCCIKNDIYKSITLKLFNTTKEFKMLKMIKHTHNTNAIARYLCFL